MFLASLEIGGAERTGISLVQGLLDQGFSVDLVVARPHGPLLAEVPAGAALIDLGHARVTRAIPALVTYLRRRRPDAVIAKVTHTCLAALVAAELSRVVTRVVVVECSTLRRISAASRLRRDRLAPHVVRLLYPRAYAVVALSERSGDNLAAVCPAVAGRLQVIPSPAVTPELWARAAEALNHPWFGPGQPPVVLAVGRLVPEKGFDSLLRGFSHLRRTRPARLVVIGEGRERASLQALAAALGVAEDVDLAGQDSNPYRYMAAAAVVVSTSVVEGLATVLIEALALDAIVVATDCESGPREILDGGRFGALVPVGDDRALAAALDAALDTALDRAAAGSRAGAVGTVVPEAWVHYGLGPVTARYLEILDLAEPLRRTRFWRRATTSCHSSS